MITIPLLFRDEMKKKLPRKYSTGDISLQMIENTEPKSIDLEAQLHSIMHMKMLN